MDTQAVVVVAGLKVWLCDGVVMLAKCLTSGKFVKLATAKQAIQDNALTLKFYFAKANTYVYANGIGTRETFGNKLDAKWYYDTFCVSVADWWDALRAS